MPAVPQSSEVMPTSNAVVPLEAEAVVRMSAGRRVGCEGMRPKASRSALESVIAASSWTIRAT